MFWWGLPAGEGNADEVGDDVEYVSKGPFWGQTGIGHCRLSSWSQCLCQFRRAEAEGGSRDVGYMDRHCQVQVYSGRGSGQVRMKMDKGGGQRAGQEVSPAGVGDCLDSMTRTTCVDPLRRFWSRGWRWKWRRRQKQTGTGVVTKLISD